MIHLIATHLAAAIGIVVFAAFLVAVFVWAMCSAAALHREPPKVIEPGDLMDENKGLKNL